MGSCAALPMLARVTAHQGYARSAQLRVLFTFWTRESVPLLCRVSRVSSFLTGLLCVSSLCGCGRPSVVSPAALPPLSSMDSNRSDTHRDRVETTFDTNQNNPRDHVGDAPSFSARPSPAEPEQSKRTLFTSALAGQSTTHTFENPGTFAPFDATPACLPPPTSFRTDAEAAMAAEASARLFPTLDAYAAGTPLQHPTEAPASGRPSNLDDPHPAASTTPPPTHRTFVVRLAAAPPSVLNGPIRGRKHRLQQMSRRHLLRHHRA